MEFSDLGKHCEFCKRQDYLPIKCNLCHKYFCKEHSSFDSHNCLEYKKNNIKKGKRKKTSSIYTESCSFKNCKKREIIKFECKLCKKNFCINHRMPEGHNCIFLKKNNINYIKKNKENVIMNNKEKNKVKSSKNKSTKYKCLGCTIV